MFSQLFLKIAPNASGTELAKLLGKSKPYVAQLRTGKRIPTDEDVILLAKKYAPKQLEEWMLCAYLDRLESKEFKDQSLKNAGMASIKKLLRHCRIVQSDQWKY